MKISAAFLVIIFIVNLKKNQYFKLPAYIIIYNIVFDFLEISLSPNTSKANLIRLKFNIITIKLCIFLRITTLWFKKIFVIIIWCLSRQFENFLFRKTKKQQKIPSALKAYGKNIKYKIY